MLPVRRWAGRGQHHWIPHERSRRPGLLSGNDVPMAGTREVEIRAPLREFLSQAQARSLLSDGLFGDDLATIRGAWPQVLAMWDATIERARLRLAGATDERVDGEWSFTETLRHLVFVTDAWIGDVVREMPSPYHRWGMPPHFIADQAGSLGLEMGARPSLEEIVDIRAQRTAEVASLLEDLTDTELERACAPRDGRFQVAGALQTVLFEEWAHHQYATRDLNRLATGCDG